MVIYFVKHPSSSDDPTKLLESSIEPKLNSVVLLLSHLFDNPDTSDLLYTNDVEALIGIFEEFLRDLTRDDPVSLQLFSYKWFHYNCISVLTLLFPKGFVADNMHEGK